MHLAVFDWSKYGDLADDLVGRQGDEAAQRTAMSRAYYAVFHAARDFLDRKGPLVARDGSAHQEVWKRMRRYDRRIAFAIRHLHQWRIVADYEDRFPGSVTRQARSSLTQARRSLRDIARLK